MKTSFFAAAALWLSCSLASAQPAPGKTEAQLLFDKCRAAYAGLKSYRGTTRTSNLSLIDGAPSIYAGSAKIVFEKPGLLRVDGKLARGGDFSILGNADGSWFRWPLEKEGDWVKISSAERAINSMTGVAASAPTTVPLLLIQSQNPRLFRGSETAKMDGEEKVNGVMCFKVTSRAPTETVSWWIDKSNLLLRRVVAYYSEEQSAARLARVNKMMEEADKRAGRPAMPAMPQFDQRFVSSEENFEIEAINETVDEKLFASPTPQ